MCRVLHGFGHRRSSELLHPIDEFGGMVGWWDGLVDWRSGGLVGWWAQGECCDGVGNRHIGPRRVCRKRLQYAFVVRVDRARRVDIRSIHRKRGNKLLEAVIDLFGR